MVPLNSILRSTVSQNCPRSWGQSGMWKCGELELLTLLGPQSRFGDNPVLSTLSLKRDCSPKRVHFAHFIGGLETKTERKEKKTEERKTEKNTLQTKASASEAQ